MGSHWTDKRAGCAALAHELMARGWKLYGYHADTSDITTDYYNPASWHGVATKGDALIAVDASMRDSGAAIEEHKQTDNGPCATCGGTGHAPGPWTLEKARAFPREYHRWELEQEHGPKSGVVNPMPDVVSPIPFKDGVHRNCFKCHGTGRDMSYALVEVGRWPVFLETPARCNWHIERGGRIIAKGIGVYGCEKEGAAKALADRMEAALAPQHYAPHPRKLVGASDSLTAGAPPAGPVPDVEVRPSKVRDGFVEIVFAAKPGDDVRGALKAAGFRWAKTSACWYGPAAALPSEAIGAALAK